MTCRGVAANHLMARAAIADSRRARRVPSAGTGGDRHRGRGGGPRCWQSRGSQGRPPLAALMRRHGPAQLVLMSEQHEGFSEPGTIRFSTSGGLQYLHSPHICPKLSSDAPSTGGIGFQRLSASKISGIAVHESRRRQTCKGCSPPHNRYSGLTSYKRIRRGRQHP